jgi:hypothetical protein
LPVCGVPHVGNFLVAGEVPSQSPAANRRAVVFDVNIGDKAVVPLVTNDVANLDFGRVGIRLHRDIHRRDARIGLTVVCFESEAVAARKAAVRRVGARRAAAAQRAFGWAGDHDEIQRVVVNIAAGQNNAFGRVESGCHVLSVGDRRVVNRLNI